MKRLAILTIVVTLAGCSTVSKLANGDEVTDFKASADANAEIAKANADVHYEQQQALKECYKQATTDIRFVACAMQGQSTNTSQHTAGRPSTNRNPTSGTEANADVAKTAVNVTGAAVGAAVIGKAVSDVVKSTSAVQAKDPVVVTQPEPVIVQPTIITVPASTTP